MHKIQLQKDCSGILLENVETIVNRYRKGCFMHLSEDELFDLAERQCNGALMTDKQVYQKRHFAKCHDCYEKFCVYIALNRVIGEAWKMEPDEEELVQGVQTKMLDSSVKNAKSQKDTYLLIQMAGTAISFVQSLVAGDQDCYWNFMRRPVAVVRSGSKEENGELYTSLQSEYSKICKDGDELLIQLDGDIFPITELGVRYEENGKAIVRKFTYNESTECYEVRIERGDKADNLTLEIIKLFENDGNYIL